MGEEVASMAANASSPVPESVTILGDVALEALALLDAYAMVLGELTVEGEPEPFYQLEGRVWRAFMDVLGYDGEMDLDQLPAFNMAEDRSRFFQEVIRERLDGPAQNAIAMSHIARDISELKTRLYV